MEAEMDKRVIPNLTTFATLAPIIWFVFGVYMLITGHFHANNFPNAFIQLTIYFTVGTAISAFLAFIPALPYIALSFLTIFIARMKIPVLSVISALMSNLLLLPFMLVVTVWTLFIGNWAIGILNGML